MHRIPRVKIRVRVAEVEILHAVCKGNGNIRPIYFYLLPDQILSADWTSSFATQLLYGHTSAQSDIPHLFVFAVIQLLPYITNSLLPPPPQIWSNHLPLSILTGFAVVPEQPSRTRAQTARLLGTKKKAAVAVATVIKCVEKVDLALRNASYPSEREAVVAESPTPAGTIIQCRRNNANKTIQRKSCRK